MGVSTNNPCLWRPRQESNPQPTDPKSGALSIELLGRDRDYTLFVKLHNGLTSTSDTPHIWRDITKAKAL